MQKIDVDKCIEEVVEQYQMINQLIGPQHGPLQLTAENYPRAGNYTRHISLLILLVSK
jgi:hypothetical protein